MNNIHLKNINFYYSNSGETILIDYSDTFKAGSNIMLVGDNGTGKSTIGRLLCGLLKPVDGTIEICGKKIIELKSRKRIHLAYYITQINQLQFVKNSIEGEIVFAESIAGKKFNRDTYNSFSLPLDFNYNPFELDINEAWRLSLLISTIVDPFVLFIDEIPSGSNNLNRQSIIEVLNDRKSRNLITFVAYQRKIRLPFDRTLTLDHKVGKLTSI